MVDSILGKSAQNTTGMIARLKVGPQSLTPQTHLNQAEQDLVDIVDIGAAAQDKIQKTRKLDSYLRLFQSALKYFTRAPKQTYSPLYSSTSVEYVKMDNPYVQKTDKTV